MNLIEKSKRVFSSFVSVPSNFRSLVYYYGVAGGGEEEWNFVYNQFKKTNVASEKRKLMYAMAASKEPWILERYLASTGIPVVFKAKHAFYRTLKQPLG